MDASIKVNELTKYFDSFLAVNHISFDVEAGEIFCFLGPNRAGKTTTMRMLTNLSRPSEGKATILGMVALPSLGRERFESMRMVVVFPALFGPRKQKISPASTSKDM